MKEMPILTLSGTPYEIGFQHGLQCKEMIREFYEGIIAVHLRNIPVQCDKNKLLALTDRNLPFLEAFSPDLVQEMQGIADGAGLLFRDILFLNSFLELEDIRPLKNAGRALDNELWGCTSFNVKASATADGKNYLGQTFDMERYYERYNVLLKINYPDGHKELVYSVAGVLGMNGMNNKGVAIVINKLVSTDLRMGVIYPFIIRTALAAQKVGDAFGAAVFSRRACGMNYQIASQDDVAWCIEESATDYQILPFVNGVAVHTNHYLSDRMRQYETQNWLTHGGSYVRVQMAQKLLQERSTPLTLADLMQMTRNHVNYPCCICAHGVEGQDDKDAFATVAASIFDLQQGIMYICHGNPCTNEYVTIDFNE